jgi:hypothetical protein
MNVVRVIAWLWGEPLGERRRPPGHFARLAPQPLSRQTVLCERMTYPTESQLAKFVLYIPDHAPISADNPRFT